MFWVLSYMTPAINLSPVVYGVQLWNTFNKNSNPTSSTKPLKKLFIAGVVDTSD
jgi:hypothetical protein